LEEADMFDIKYIDNNRKVNFIVGRFMKILNKNIKIRGLIIL